MANVAFRAGGRACPGGAADEALQGPLQGLLGLGLLEPGGDLLGLLGRERFWGRVVLGHCNHLRVQP